MIFWYGNAMSGWGYGLMTVGMIVFWALVVVGIVVLVRSAGSPSQHTTVPPRSVPTPREILADRYARGEIDDEEYQRPRKILDADTPPPRGQMGA